MTTSIWNDFHFYSFEIMQAYFPSHVQEGLIWTDSVEKRHQEN